MNKLPKTELKNGMRKLIIREWLNKTGHHSIGLIHVDFEEESYDYTHYAKKMRNIEKNLGKTHRLVKRAQTLKKKIDKLPSGVELAFTVGDCSRTISLDFSFLTSHDIIRAKKEDNENYDTGVHSNSMAKLKLLKKVIDRTIQEVENSNKKVERRALFEEELGEVLKTIEDIQA